FTFKGVTLCVLCDTMSLHLGGKCRRVVMLSRRSFVANVLASPAVGLLSSRAYATSWPSRTIKIIVPFGPGGSADVVARYVSMELQEKLCKDIRIQKRPSAAAHTS